MDNHSPLEQTSVYIPIDRRHALAQGKLLPERTAGAALFADISGFTPLTDALTKALGPRRGIEELTRQLNLVYDALIAQVDRYGGSVLGFSGDAITCWFDEQLLPAAPPAAPLRAVACALGMQQAMQQFAAVMLPGQNTVALAVKIAVANGPALRFIVGDPTIQLMDVVAGATLARMAIAEQLAGKGQVIVDAPTTTLLREKGAAPRWRALQEPNASFSVFDELSLPVEPSPWPPLTKPLAQAQLRPWLLPAVYERLREGLGESLLELRPVAALFLNFGGIDYDNDQMAGQKLDVYIHWVQQTLARYDGALLQLTIGEKGNYLYAAFGAPIAHEDDAQRASLAALELCSPPAHLDFIEPVRVGLSQGLMRTGAYGGTTRRTYGVLGDEVNLAARLMQHAAPGTVLISRRIQKALGPAFHCQTLAPVTVKGKAEAVPVARLQSGAAQQAEPTTPLAFHSGPLVGRETELAQLEQFAQPILKGQFAGAVCIYGEAGVGKSRLVYELQQRLVRSQKDGALPRWFTCPAEGILRQPLHPFKYWLNHYFAQSRERSTADNKASFTHVLEALIANLQSKEKNSGQLASELARARSVLGALVDLQWEGSLYEQLDPGLRLENMLSALKALIKAESLRQAVILHIEDAHWLDAESRALLRTLTQNVNDYPFMVLLTSRPLDNSQLDLSLAEGTPQHTLVLGDLSPASSQAIAEQILQGALAKDLATFLAEKTNGNPFFVEQLVLDLQERQALSRQHGVWTVLQKELAEVPASINAVLVARLDRLAAQVKAVVQTAAVLGQEFQVRVLSQMLQNNERLSVSIKQAEAQVVWSALSEMRYIFKHALLRDAAYTMQLHAQLCQLHALAGAAIEHLYAANLSPYYADLAYHYGKAQDVERERHYAALLGEALGQTSAFKEALAATKRALELTPETGRAERAVLLVRLGSFCDKLGDYAAAREYLLPGLALARELNDLVTASGALNKLSWLAQVQGDRDQACALSQECLALARASGQPAALATALMGASQYQPDDAGSLQYLEESRAIFQEIGQRLSVATCLLNMGNLVYEQRNYAKAASHYQDSLAIYEEFGNRWGIANCLCNLGLVAYWRQDYPGAFQHTQAGLSMAQEIGDRELVSICLPSLGYISTRLGQPQAARQYFRQSLPEIQAIGAAPYMINVIVGMAELRLLNGEYAHAAEYLGLAQAYPLRDREREALMEPLLATLQTALPANELAAALERGRAMDLNLVIEQIARGEQ